MYRLVSHKDLVPHYATGTVRCVRDKDGAPDFLAETTTDETLAAQFPQFSDAYNFRLRLALDAFRVEEAVNGRSEKVPL